MWLGLYLINLGVALLAAIPLFKLLNAQLGHSLAIEKLMPGFDFTVFMDFIHEHGIAFEAVIGQSQFLLLVFLLLYIFLTGGILTTFKDLPKAFDWKDFWSGSAAWFWRFFRLTIYFLILHGVLIVIFVGIYQLWLDNSQILLSDQALYRSLVTIICVYLIFATLLVMLHDYTKIHIIHNEPQWLYRSMLETSQLVFKNFGATFGLYLLNLLTFLVLAGIYYLIREVIAPNSGWTILILLIIGQLFVMGRVGMKLLNLSSGISLYKKIQ